MRKEKGITLISLVVTIIVLIILATVSITLILGQNGVINKAKQAKENMEIAATEEAEMLNEVYVQMVTQTGSTTGSTTGGDSSTEEGNDDSKINDFKKAIADYIGEVASALKPAYTADTATFGESIKSIPAEVTKIDESTAATAEDIAEGKIAYVNGEKVIGNLKNENKNTIVKVALSTTGRGSYTINVASFIANNNLDIDYTKLTNNNFGYERQSASTNTAGDSIKVATYSYDASTGILSISNPYVDGSGRLFSNGIPYLYYVTN